MSYEYMLGLGTDKTASSDSQNAEATFVPSPGWLTPEQSAAEAEEFSRLERIDHIESYNETIAMIRAGDEEARRELRRNMAHGDVVRVLAQCAQPENITTDDRREFCDVLNLAKQVAEGNDPLVRRRNMLIAGGVGAGVLVLLGLVFLKR